MAFSPPSSHATSQYSFGHAGRDAPLFQPPKSPASIATAPSFATATDYFSSGSRKRSRSDSREGTHTQQTPWTATPSWVQYPTQDDTLHHSAYGQHSGLVNERYRLADGFDTPSLQPTSRLEQLTVHEHEFRRRLRDDDLDLSARGSGLPLSGPLARERNGAARMPPTPDEIGDPSWKSLAFGLVSKAFSFGSNVVRGFYAGGGKGYELNDCALVGSDLLQERHIARSSTPIPGSWHDNEFLGDFEQDSPAFTQPPLTRPPNKRRQTDRDTWVMIGTPDLEASEPTSPKRKLSSSTVPRSSLAPRPTASRASSRRSLAPNPRRQSSYVAANGSPAIKSQSPPPASPQTRRASVAPTRSPQTRPRSGASGVFMSPEAERFAKRHAKQERAADKAMTSMSKRMEDMIRQAQQALGTKVSVEGGGDGMDLEDEGYVDDDW